MNIEQIKEILAGAPDGATKCATYIDTMYFKPAIPHGLKLYNPFFDKWQWVHDCSMLRNLRDLSDLREILELRQEVERLNDWKYKTEAIAASAVLCEGALGDKTMSEMKAILSRHDAELSATVERLRAACQLGIDMFVANDINVPNTIETMQDAIESTPHQNLNAVKREVAESAVKTALRNLGEGSLSEQDISSFAKLYANTNYPSGKE